MKKFSSAISVPFLFTFFLNSIVLAYTPPLDEVDDSYADLIHPTEEASAPVVVVEPNGPQPVSEAADLSKSDFLGAIQYVTDVKTQGQRNTCTVFSITALLETLFLRKYSDYSEIDFSEQWGQYLASIATASGGAKGSTVPINFSQIRQHGIATENKLPYNQNLWKADTSEVAEACAGLSGLNFTRCLYGQANPHFITMSDSDLLHENQANFVEARTSANRSKSYLMQGSKGQVLKSVNQIKARLRAGIPMTLEINVFYGSWNIGSVADSLGILNSPDQYRAGIVNFPENDSLDRINSPTKRARHSVLIVGYDDSIEVEYSKKMRDGTTKTFKRKGVYYFKNSWGTNRFGTNFRFEKYKVPGFGMITQDYAHQMGQFYGIDLAK